MKGKAIFLNFCMIFVVICVTGQPISPKVNTTQLSSIPITGSFSTGTYNFHPIFNIGSNNYTKNLSFFCRQEYKLEKWTGLPLRFRLGALPYNDWLEGKKGAIAPWLR